MNTYRKLHLPTAGHTVFISTYRTFVAKDQIQGHKASPNNFKEFKFYRVCFQLQYNWAINQ